MESENVDAAGAAGGPEGDLREAADARLDVCHLDELYGLSVHTIGEQPLGDLELPEPGAVAWRLDVGWQEDRPFSLVWGEFVETVDTAEVRALIIGPWWEDEYESIEETLRLVAADAGRFPGLRALFIADVIGEECEVSWLEMSDITPVLKAFPSLEELGVRGGGHSEDSSLGLTPLRHDRLRVLRFESGGLPREVVRAVGASELPALEHLEFWFGADEYGGDTTLEDLAPVLSGERFPRLRHLGLQNSESQDAIAAAVATAPVVARLESLSLSMGVLTDAGARALLTSESLTRLGLLDLRHNYLTAPVEEQLRSALEPHGVRIESERGESWTDSGGDERFYVAVSE